MPLLEKFSLKGKSVVVLGSNGILGRIAVEVVNELGGRAIGLDLPEFDLRHDIYASSGHHGVINCAIGNQSQTYPALAGFGSDLEIGLVAAARAMETFKPISGGSYVNVGSDLSFKAPDPNRYPGAFKPASYSVIKHGIVGLTRYYAAIWGNDQIRVNTLCPGSIDQGQSIPDCPLHRLAQPHELQPAIAFLLTDASSYMTGASLCIDGGSTCW